MKRITHWPQLVLGLAFNWGALLGSSAVLGHTDWRVSLPLYFGHVAWTIVYDTIYAHQDKQFDVTVGVKSTALLFGSKTVPVLSAFSLAFASLVGMSGYANGAGLAFYSLSVLAPLVHLSWLLWRLDIDSPQACLRAFNLSALTGLLVWLGCLADYAIKTFL
ncbi:hypothetical protein CROQUDRAFT_664989 [Cronartium quercuum f. sp. fusiforme G11]|uniref:Uncharacterized protein n=1 Tax=Cronartium quercuum f. sp. fusiforme G11 TaxID=708437 RepID=A0A9P6T6H5_9BASI|nr:hypothetical protein CROQUDRAFT_664989 [Cronartium quercuum f. sp. fusiforme G11]